MGFPDSSFGKESTYNAGDPSWIPELGRCCCCCCCLSGFSRFRLCDPIDGSPPGSPIPGILKARTLEWVAIAFSNA